MNEKISNILLVEDEAAHVELIRRAFEDQPTLLTNLIVARSLGEAKEKIAISPPHLVIVDFILPDGQGTKLLAATQEESAFPIILMTSHGDEHVAVQAMKGGALEYVVKSDQSLIAMPRIVERVLREWGYIVAKREADKEIRLLSTAVEQTAESILITDPQGAIIYVNPAFEETTGYSKAEVLGRTPNILKSGQQNGAFYRQLWATITQGRVWHDRLINRRKDGSQYTADMTITPARNQQGQIINYVSAQRDITNELRLEDRLRQGQKMEAIGQLAGGVAHDFNNILQAILGYAYMVKMTIQADSPAQSDLDQVIKATNRATTLVRQLLTFSRQETLKPQLLDLNEVIDNLLKMLRRIIGEHINLDVHTQNGLKTVYADPGQIEQVLINLCVNGRDAMPEGGKITIETENRYVDPIFARNYPWAEVGDYVVLSVSDTGTGILPEIQDRIFEPFFTTKEIGEGTGLGLATVYAITKQHQGGINVYSELGYGATFQIYLPASQKFNEVQAEKRSSLKPCGGSETILLAEDDDTVRELAVSVLDQAGYRVLVARDGEEALKLFEQQPDQIDLAVLDAIMPKKNGRVVYDLMKTRRAKLPVLFSTGYGFNILKNIHLPDGGIQLIRKPYSPRELLQKVRDILDT